jgi:hypothetical protein
MMKGRLTAAAVALAGVAAVGAAYASASPASSATGSTPGSQLAKIRAATAPYHSLSAAQHAGWNGLFQDVNGLTCIADTETPSMGGMGYHWVNGANIGSADPTKPAALIYASTADGKQRLAGMEYLVLDDPAGSVPQPFINGQGFMHNDPGNRFLGDTAFWSLHVWAWDHNPSGTYAMWNPKITCP